MLNQANKLWIVVWLTAHFAPCSKQVASSVQRCEQEKGKIIQADRTFTALKRISLLNGTSDVTQAAALNMKIENQRVN